MHISRSRRGIRACLLAVGILVAALASGCRTVVEVDIVADQSGSGTVTVTARLDAEAVKALGGTDKVVTTDLSGTGWSVAKPVPELGGGASVTATHPWADGGELAAVLEQIGGRDGLFTHTSAGAEHGVLRDTVDVSTHVAVTGDPAQFSDEALTHVLDGLALGRSPEELKAAGMTDPAAGELVVRVRVPGAPVSERRFSLTGAKPSEATVAASATAVQWPVIGVGALALLAGAAGVVLLVRSRRARGATGDGPAGGVTPSA